MRYMKITFAFITSLLLNILVAHGQRHYQGVSGIELNYGTNIFQGTGNYVNLSYSKYINRKSYWKIGLNYFEKRYDYTVDNATNLKQEDKGKDLYLDASYNYTIATNLESLYWNIGAGAFLGAEYAKYSENEYQFILGPKIETELEIFIFPRVAILTRLQQHWNPLSLQKWNTAWNIGIKFLLY